MAIAGELFFDLYTIPGMTEARLRRLLQRFGDPERIFGATAGELLEVERIDMELVNAIGSYRRSDKLKALIGKAEQLDVKVISCLDEQYPSNLRDMPQMPPVLFVRGELKPTDRLAVAVVGTRSPTYYGRQVAERFSREMARAGITIVSGLARGIDTAAHRGALEAGGRTIAVTGCGIDQCYPPENRRLCEEIVANGAILSEFPLGMGPMALNFPRRNRIVSALSRAVVAVEAGERSGVLNTVAWAFEQGREVYSVPGRITDAKSAGTNRLLRQGAKPLTSADEILTDLGVAVRQCPQEQIDATAEEAPVLEFIGNDPIHIDELCEALGVSMPRLLGLLLQMELRGVVRQLPGKYFVRC
ncbi:MAG: DNA-processing protein DprA [candidate division WOR-3 bacterium]